MNELIEKLIELFRKGGIDLLDLIRAISAPLTKKVEEQLNKQVESMASDIQKDAIELVIDIIRGEYKAGSKEAIESLIKQGFDEKTLNTTIKTLVHTEAVQNILDEAFYSILEATEFMASDVKDRIKEVVNKANASSLIEGLSRKQAIKDAVAELAAEQITGMIYKNGAHMPADKYMANVIQYFQRKAHVDGVLNKLIDNGHDLVYVNKVGITCEMCAKYQGRVYSISGNDLRFPKLEKRPPYHGHCVHNLTAWVEEYKSDDEIKYMQQESNKPFKDNRTEKNIEKYNEIQRKKSKKNETYKQWLKFKARMPDDTPDLKVFASLKARNTKSFQELQQAYRQVGFGIKKRSE
ncbi:phage minor capsid protein [Schinkia azotoformans]|uniref:phage minor capsid protein n=1 Tax=Schinkia azotoformans TaxID=1454 RepID=UPI002DB8473A|nr:phage minor capsid protein [Schinkia azotoformans]MEC1714751.1 minor capsid protein [Schinkia azotoformans]MEC1757493.1 minor capsid protein [Schinkia azotoformans]